MSEKRIIRRRRAGSTGSDSDEEVVLSGASQEDGVSYSLSLHLLLNGYQIIFVRKEFYSKEKIGILLVFLSTHYI